jgi:hypothetical protein
MCSSGGDDVETCNGVDDDCDSVIDEGNGACGGVCDLSAQPGDPCDGGDSDDCADDTYSCDGINAVLCSLGDDSSETCNASDDDCDGTTDEGGNQCGGICDLLAAVGSGCDGDDSDLCSDDQFQCDGLNALACSLGDDTLELCNSEDDDCDGTTDEGGNQCGGVCDLGATLGTPCDGGDTDLCSDDQVECDGANATRCSLGGDNAEVCNGGDDDCDGATDEGGNQCGGVCDLGATLGTPCDGGDTDQCCDDQVECDGANATRCSLGSDNAEVCNGGDDDCDGASDNTASPCCSGNGTANPDGSCSCAVGYAGAQCAATAACSGALTLFEAEFTRGVSVTGSTLGAPDTHGASCGVATGGEQIYRIVPSRDGIITVSSNMAGTNFNTILSVRTDCETPASEVACNDDFSGNRSQVSWFTQAGVSYYLVVDGASGAQGAVQLAFTFCGDGYKDTDEQCDDGNSVATDDCSNVCATSGSIVYSERIDPAYAAMSYNQYGPGGGYHCSDPVSYTCTNFRPSRSDSSVAFCDCLDNIADAAGKSVGGSTGQCPHDVNPTFWTSGGGRYRMANLNELAANYSAGIMIGTSMATGDFAWSCTHRDGINYGARKLYFDGTLPTYDGGTYCGYPSYPQHYTACVDTSGTGAGPCGTRCGLR